MHILTKRPFVDAAERFPNQRKTLLDVYRVLSRNSVRLDSPEAMRQVFPSLDNFVCRDK
jgi:mRNA interferase HigB